MLLLIAEYLWRVKKYHSEFTRKFIHITVGTFAAFWPWFLSWRQIELLAALFLLVILASRLLTIFGSIHLIGRKTVGEVLFAVSIGLTALISPNRLIFAAALLHLSLGDGLAAIAGTKYGKKTSYKIFGQYKTLVGSATFLVCSFLILSIYFANSNAGGAWPTLLWLPLAATLLENMGLRGSDNVLVPVGVALALRFI
jgi:phytol kinase